MKLGDQTDQHLYGVAANDDAIVAVGTDSSASITHPMILHSSDGGDTWSPSTIDDESKAETARGSWTFDIAASPDHFVASGSDASGRIRIWTSPDGKSWSLADTGPSFREQDWSSAMIYAEGRYWMVGGNTKATGRATARVMLWTSSDGAAWSRRDLGRDLRGIVGSPSTFDVAVRANTVMIAGGIEDNALANQPNRLAIWRSEDSGKSFTSDRTPLDLGGDFRAYATDLVVYAGGFYIAAEGDGTSEQRFGDSTWDAVLLREEGLGNWQKISPNAFSTDDDDQSPRLLRGPDGWVMTGSRETDQGLDAVIAVGRDIQEMTQIGSPSLRGGGDQSVNAAVTDDDQVLLVGGTERTGSDEAAIWRVRRGQVTELELPEAARGGEPSVGVGALIRTDDGFLISGYSSDSPVVWTSKDFEAWQAVGLPGRTAQSTSVRATGSIELRDGSPLVLGWRSWGNGSDAVAWRLDDDTWDDEVPTAFVNRGEGGYGTVNVTDVARRGKTIVLAANSYMNGQDEAHPLVSISGGRTWSPATGERQRSADAVSDYFATTQWREFAAPVNGTLSMNTVTSTTKGWLIGGSLSQANQRSKPVIWRSRDGRRWDGPTPLPMPHGAWSAGIGNVVARGKTVVATGWLNRQEGDESSTWVSWLSSDGGSTFAVGEPPVEADASALELLVIPDGFLVLGQEGPDEDPDARAWMSVGGGSWEVVDLGSPRAEGPGQQSYSAALVDGDNLRLIGSDVPPTGGGFYTITVPLPRG